MGDRQLPFDRRGCQVRCDEATLPIGALSSIDALKEQERLGVDN
jgi:hypothetical protein